MSNLLDRTRLTRDVDAVTDMQDEVEHEAREMARGRRNLSPDWFNGRVRPMLPLALDVERMEAFRSPGISVSVASPRHLLAMKVRAARGERDLEDIVLLCEALGITSAREAISIADEVWGAGMLREESVFLATEGLLDRGLAP